MEPNELPDFLASIRHTDTYKVPPRYFDTLADDILSQVHVPPASDILFSEPPSGYFDGLANTILQKIKSAQKSDVQLELEEIEPSLAEISRNNLYTVPQGYFDTFQVPVETKEKQAPAIKLSRRPVRWITYAAAAVVTGIIATGAVLFAGKNDIFPSSEKYKVAVAKLSDNELADYLDNTTPDVDAIPVSNTGITNSNGLYKQLLNNISDNDIQQYLNENNDSDEKTTTGI